jgi:alpha-L-rhamnosidase
VYFPAENEGLVLESGLPAAEAVGVKFLRMENAHAVYAVGSGVYQFSGPIK